MTPTLSYLSALDTVSDDLDMAIGAADWARVQELERQARPFMSSATDAAQAGEVAVALVVERLERLQALFELARAGAVKSRDEASAALKASEKTHSAAQAYLRNARR
ncbi:hypothetical protein [Hydrocarboniclastica marina]|uniref:Flagellar protein FliT n=1 Tax=Hydrocarboniclastica marina TaxID=2259620 RepID=A0A4P7XH23_9ALTE|nr:hypothetical protein [Hydrocarboniclastica marina]MAL98952.1 hypothetical protein [Alteromonadaceae bacterium]QCF26328.1 hypothetical protein soil367_10485 [Hydrocarboniclastica marina]